MTDLEPNPCPKHDCRKVKGTRVQPQQEQRVERRLAAIFAADVAGYSRLMSQDEAGTLRALAAARDIMDRLIAEHGGRIATASLVPCWEKG
jgi:adenylate cyclase